MKSHLALGMATIGLISCLSIPFGLEGVRKIMHNEGIDISGQAYAFDNGWPGQKNVHGPMLQTYVSKPPYDETLICSLGLIGGPKNLEFVATCGKDTIKQGEFGYDQLFDLGVHLNR